MPGSFFNGPKQELFGFCVLLTCLVHLRVTTFDAVAIATIDGDLKCNGA